MAGAYERLAGEGIRLRSYRTGWHSTVCPKCSHLRRKKTARCLSVSIRDDGTVYWKCWHCGFVPGESQGARPYVAQNRPEAVFATVPPETAAQFTEARQAEPTALCRWLERIFPWPVVQETLDLYHVGRSKEGHTVFWTIDAYGRFRQPRVTSYGEDGNSDSPARRGWVPKGMRTENGYSPCMFGEHLFLLRPGVPVVYVEGEKTALCGHCLCPELLWVSINGAENKRRAAECPHNDGRAVLLMFDPDEPGRKAEQYVRTHIGSNALCVQGLDTWPGAGKEITGGYNLADYVYNPYGGEMVIEASPELRVPKAGVPALFEAVSLLQARTAKLFEF